MMRRNTFLAANLSMLLASSVWADGIHLQEVVTEGDFAMQSLQTETQGEISFFTNWGMLNDEEARGFLRAFSPALPPGEWPLGARAMNKDANVLVLADAPAAHVTIDFLKDDGDENTIVVRAFDEEHRPVRLAPDQFAVYDLQERPLPFALEAPDLSIAVNVLIDRSGSMASVAPTVVTSARQFMDALPNRIACKVASFAEDVTSHTPGYVPCTDAAAMIPDIKTGGGTALLPAMHNAYLDMASLDTAGALLLVITDGGDTTQMAKATVQVSKSWPTFALWIGGYQTETLTGVADFQAAITSASPTEQQIQDWLDVVLGQVSEALNMQHTIVVERPYAIGSDG